MGTFGGGFYNLKTKEGMEAYMSRNGFVNHDRTIEDD